MDTSKVPTPGDVRREAGFTAAEACRRLKPPIHKGSLFGAERGATPVSEELVAALAKVYGVPAKRLWLAFLAARLRFLRLAVRSTIEQAEKLAKTEAA